LTFNEKEKLFGEHRDLAISDILRLCKKKDGTVFAFVRSHLRYIFRFEMRLIANRILLLQLELNHVSFPNLEILLELVY
jgi:hypothetical protein